MATRQQAPWASGKHAPGRKRPVSSAGKRGLGRFAGNAKKGWRKTLRRHPSVGIAASVLLALVAVVSLVLGLVLESALYYLVVAIAGLGALAMRRAAQMERERQKAPPRARPTSGGPKTPPPSAASTPPPAGGVVKCTETSRPIADCDCASRHVASSDGARRYGLPVGSPMGRRKKTEKPSGTTKSG